MNLFQTAWPNPAHHIEAIARSILRFAFERGNRIVVFAQFGVIFDILNIAVPIEKSGSSIAVVITILVSWLRLDQKTE
jgi:hypothetical protein